MNKKDIPKVLFTSVEVDCLEAEATLPAKFKRALSILNLAQRVKGKKVAVKIHAGYNLGYTTIHPLFIRILVRMIKDAGAQSVKVMDGNITEAVPRGYTEEVLGCPVVSCFGKDGKYVYKEKIGFGNLDDVLMSGEAVDSDFFLDLSHVKGHGGCGFGGAIKNIGMGIIPQESRGKLHVLEGGLAIDRSKCKFCKKCVDSCPNGAILIDKEKKTVNFFFHNCTYCRHCSLICPEKAITMQGCKFETFAEAMAVVTSKFLKKFNPENLLYVNFLTDITIFCDCWGYSTPPLVPDIGILYSNDIAAIETASLDMIKTENLLPAGLPKNRKKLVKGKHLFEKIHSKDPFLMIKFMEKYYDCSMKYKLEEIK